MSGARLRFEACGRAWEADLERARSIARPIHFDESSLRAFGLPAASSEPFRGAGFVLSLAAGGALNCEGLTIWPHGNGTHTETVGHIAHGAPSPAELIGALPMLAALVSVPLARLGALPDRYEAGGDQDDQVIGAGSLSAKLSLIAAQSAPQALVLRAPSRARGERPAYLTSEAMRVVRGAGIEHLVLELPSVDRDEDGGALLNHRIFWGLKPGESSAALASGAGRTITELAQIPHDLADGLWALQIQLAPLMTDAVPSRPFLAPLTRLGPL